MKSGAAAVEIRSDPRVCPELLSFDADSEGCRLLRGRRTMMRESSL